MYIVFAILIEKNNQKSGSLFEKTTENHRLKMAFVHVLLLAPGVSVAVLVAGLVAYLAINGIQLYRFSQENRDVWASREVKTRSELQGAVNPNYPDFFQNESISAYDYSSSDNIKYTTLLNTYDHANAEVMVGAALLMLLSLAFLQLAVYMACRGKQFFASAKASKKKAPRLVACFRSAFWCVRASVTRGPSISISNLTLLHHLTHSHEHEHSANIPTRSKSQSRIGSCAGG